MDPNQQQQQGNAQNEDYVDKGMSCHIYPRSFHFPHVTDQ